MKLATLANGTPDGRLVRVSDDATRMIGADPIAGSLREAIEDWARCAPALAALDPTGSGSERFDVAATLAPLPRAWQFLDGSAYPSHGELLQQAYDLPPIPPGPPLMYQGLSHEFLSGHADVALPDEAHGIDFEAEFAVVVDHVPMGTDAQTALGHIKLVLLLNDWSLRAIGAAEMRTGFGWVRGKPASSLAPIAVTPDTLGAAWRDGRIHLPMLVDYAGRRFGAAGGGAMQIGFHDLVAHAASTRSLCAGTIIGSGTVSNESYREVGSSCIAERRAIEMVDNGAATTGFMRFGDRVRIEVVADGASIFGAIDQRVVQR
ncbi:fumarylacetoacetate hydrolase family protein [Sphingomonas sp. RB3P16]|uniref:fumarylacetoacetate hydrolase family protein n=1 Tax=Parasphingomonas frigoris TaxID=3096163 RepID=UPI002FC8A1EE